MNFRRLAVAFVALMVASGGVYAQKIVGHTSNVNHSQIFVEGVTRPLKVLHLTDSHMVCDGAEDEPYQQYMERMQSAYSMINHYKSGERVTTKETFAEIISKAKEEKVDLIALTGDNLNYPSPTGVKYMVDLLEESQIPYIYVAGNHDWHYEGMEGTTEQLREEWRERHLKPLYQGANPSHSVEEIAGINVVKIDNSIYQISREQLDFYRKIKAEGKPILLLMHIPVYMPTVPESMGDPAWGAATDKYYMYERRAQWPESGNTETTIEFRDEILSTDGVVVLAGHTHSFRVDQWRGMLQIVANRAATGEYRIVDIEAPDFK